jgi:hypothetical protein
LPEQTGNQTFPAKPVSRTNAIAGILFGDPALGAALDEAAIEINAASFAVRAGIWDDGGGG